MNEVQLPKPDQVRIAVIGLGLTMTGTYWFRRAGLEEAP